MHGKLTTLAMAALVALVPGVAIGQIDSCPDPFDNPIVLLPTISGGDENTIGADVATGEVVGDVDFCGALDTVFCSLGPLTGLLPEVADFANLVKCEFADINGPIDPEAEIPVSGNGIPDGTHELAVIGAVLNDTSFDQNGLTHADVLAAWDSNFELIRDLTVEALVAEGYWSLVPGVAPFLVDSLAYSLAGYALIGDAETSAAINELFALLADLGIDPPDPSAIATVPGFFGKNDDADGDGLTNQGEFDASTSGTEYVTFALDPNQPGEAPPVDPGDEGVNIVGPGMVEETSAVELRLRVADGITPLSTQWQKLVGGEFQDLTGETGTSLIFDAITLDDEGFYRAVITVDDGTKAIVELESSAFFLNVVPEGELPLAGGLGLGLLAGVCAIAGAASLRRRK
ncbi:MAG: hypothetical protein ACLFTT_10565 [Candidatus Hydrogenedentota bacterium]